MLLDRLAGTRRHSSSTTVGALLACVLAGALPGCSDGPATPGELFDLGHQAMLQGRPGVFWDLMTLDQQARVRKGFDDTKRIVERNPGARNLVEQWGFRQSEWREALRCPAPEIWTRAHKGMEQVMVGARIVDAAIDPQTGSDVLVLFETVHGQQFRWVMRNEPGRGWRFQDQAAAGQPKEK